MTIERDLYDQLLRVFPAVPPENGCILGSKDGVICVFSYDGGNPITHRAIYSPNVFMLNQVIARWTSEGIRFAGLCHSHPQGQTSLSGSDIAYIGTIMGAMPDSVKTLYFPLVFPGQKILSFVAHRHNERVDIQPDDITIKL